MTEGVSSVLEKSSLCRMRPCSDERDWLSPMSIGVLSAEQANRTLGSVQAKHRPAKLKLESIKFASQTPSTCTPKRPPAASLEKLLLHDQGCILGHGGFHSSMTEGVSLVMEEFNPP
ncbi:hypothetical protein PGT21_037027 [Puccinia graminis f. sp. tritici]|uniref:Uncharacterized protein n=1 Tax=Puccinia graminis f. sp. tritici TaxID=56615 RepID=A0A5B0QQE8_PUCGR|nr:hypothetical protein PGT21_037027 [Puccinia graminis f. sp. tritici]